MIIIAGYTLTDASARDAPSPRTRLGRSRLCHRGAEFGLSQATGRRGQELAWQVAQMSLAMRTALQTLPPVGENRSGPLGPGLLASGQVGAFIRALQAAIASGAERNPQR